MYCGRDFVALSKSSVTALPSRPRENTTSALLPTRCSRLDVRDVEGCPGCPAGQSRWYQVFGNPRDRGPSRGAELRPRLGSDSSAPLYFVVYISVKLAPAARAQLINCRPVTGTVTVASARRVPPAPPPAILLADKRVDPLRLLR